MNKLTEWIKEHQVASFFVLTYITSWLLMLPYLITRNEQLFGLLVLMGVFCPAFTGIIISRIIEPGRKQNNRKARRIAFFVTWIVATSIFTLNVRTTSQIESPFAIAIFAIVGLFPAFIIASAYSKFPGIRKSLSSLVKPRGNPFWYLFALLIIPFIRLVSIPISHMLGWSVSSEMEQTTGGIELVGLVVVSFSYTLVFTGGLNEETGWTGFALPRLQSRHNPLTASVILWFFWILWHMPGHFAGLWNPTLESLVRSLIGAFFARFIFTWLYNRTSGGILTAVLLHTSGNTAFAFIPATQVARILEAILAIVIIVSGRMWQKLSVDSPAIYRSTGNDI